MLEHAFFATLGIRHDGTPVERIYAEPQFDLGFLELPSEPRVFMEDEGVFLLMAEKIDGGAWQVAAWVPKDAVTDTMLTDAVAGDVKACLFDNGPVRMANRCFAQMEFVLRTPDLSQRKRMIAEALTTARRVHAKHPEIRMLREMVRGMTTDDECMVAAAVFADHAAWHLREGREADAERLANLAVQADTRYSFAHYNLAYALHSKKDRDAAITAYQKVLELQPCHGPTWGNVAHAWLTDMLGMPDAGRKEAWQHATELDPHDVCCLAFLADNSTFQLAQHADYLKRIVERDPGNREARHNLVTFYTQTNAAEAACEAAAEFVTSCCGCEEAYVDLILTAYRLARWETVMQAFELWERTGTDRWPRRHWLAQAIGIKRRNVENSPSKWMCRVYDFR
jgi:Flp pilus assembly protein TadD